MARAMLDWLDQSHLADERHSIDQPGEILRQPHETHSI
jgi:hypothetical protein